ncbi:hypothetical protein C0993_008076 [Termitomyces sp. T159_Od127]|nr:hypothetical protein C0993_008076 [Termitomyces sp. T159_Od127]
METAQLNTILTFYDITDPPIDSELSGIPIPLLRKAIGILGKSGRAQILGVADGEGVILLEAVTEFKERIVPIFRRAEEQSREIEHLKRQLSKHESEVAANARQFATLERKRDEACHLWQKTIAERDKAIDLSNQAVLKINQLQKDLYQVQAQETKLESTRILYKTQLLEHKEMEQRQNEKIKSLKRQLIIAQQEVQKERDDRIKVDSSAPLSQCLKRRAISSDTPSQTPVELIDATSKSTLFDAMPKPDQSGSNWNFMQPDLKKQKVVDTFPVRLDKRGHAVGPIQTGSRKTIRIRR